MFLNAAIFCISGRLTSRLAKAASASKRHPSQERPPNIRAGDVSCTVLATQSAYLQIPCKHPMAAFVFFERATNPFTFGSLFAACRIHCACHEELRLNILKWLEPVGVVDSLTFTCASHHNPFSGVNPRMVSRFRNWLRTQVTAVSLQIK